MDKTQITSVMKESKHITKTSQTSKIYQKSSEQFHAYKFENLGKMNTFFFFWKALLELKKKDSVDGLIPVSEIEFLIINLKKKET